MKGFEKLGTKVFAAMFAAAALMIFLPVGKVMAGGDPVHGEVYASQIAYETSVSCDGPTTIIMDCDICDAEGAKSEALVMIDAGGYDLTIKNKEGDKRHTLTIRSNGDLIRGGNVRIEGIDLILKNSEKYDISAVQATHNLTFIDVNLKADLSTDYQPGFEAGYNLVVKDCSSFVVHAESGSDVLTAKGTFDGSNWIGGDLYIFNSTVDIDAKRGVAGRRSTLLSSVKGKIKGIGSVQCWDGSVVLSGCTLTLAGMYGMAIDSFKTLSIYSGKLDISSEALCAVATGVGDLQADGGCQINIQSACTGIETKDLEMEGCSLNITAGLSPAYPGIRAAGAKGVILDHVTGSITAGSEGIYSGSDVRFVGCDLTVKGNASAVMANDIILADDNWCKEPSYPSEPKLFEKTVGGKDYKLFADPGGGAAVKAVIAKKRLSDSPCTIKIPDAEYRQPLENHEPKPVVAWDGKELVLGTDYKILSYEDNQNAGTGRINLYGAGSFDDGIVVKTFSIKPADIAKADADLINIWQYSGEAVEPEVRLYYEGFQLSPGTDFTVAYKDNVKAGIASVMITGKGNFAGTKTCTFEIQGSNEDPGKTEETEKPEEKKAEDGTPTGKGASAKTAEDAILAMKTDEAPAGSVFSLLQLKASSTKKGKVDISWKKPSGTAKFVIYGNACGKNNKTGKSTRMKKLKTTKKTKWTFTKVAGNAVKADTYYKFVVVALDKSGTVVSTSKSVHVAAKGKKYGNDKSVKTAAEKKKNKITIKKGKKFELKAKPVVQSKKLKVKRHRDIVYESTNPKIAKVSKTGVITAKKKGSCYVYAYAQNGVFAKIKVTVKK